eukprot:Nitzschia sp. Nitz4//scaffold19_size178191//36096//37438//NITZ4_001960-RA/size178191-augustus-gene-0.35-mRNA-1//1//CDS//3329540628//7533//frame0
MRYFIFATLLLPWLSHGWYVPGTTSPVLVPSKPLPSNTIHWFSTVRGGNSDEEGTLDDEEQNDEYDDVEEEESESDTEEVELEDDEPEESAVKESASTGAYVEPFIIPSGIQMFATIGCMILGRRVNLESPSSIRIIRLAFIAQLLCNLSFMIYVRITATKNKDWSVVQIEHPLSGMLKSQLSQPSPTNMLVKNMASSFLSSRTTAMEYDLKQASAIQTSIISQLFFMWLLHLKLGRTQPLVIQVFTGMVNLVYNPLFQLYILGRNLERPFKSTQPPQNNMFASMLPGAPGSKQESETVEVVETDDS